MVDTDDTRRTMDDERRTTPWVWHELPTGELKIFNSIFLMIMNLCLELHVDKNDTIL